MVTRIYTKEQKQWLRDNVVGRSVKQLTEELNEQFGTNFTVKQIAHLKGDLGLRNGNNTKFSKGRIPVNKGQRMSDEQRVKLERTWFPKGHIPANAREIGSEYVDVDGYVVVKVSKNKWVHKQRLVWEKHHGPVPKNHRVIFLDGNRQNCDINNLCCVNHSTVTRLSRFKMRYQNAEATSASVKILQILDEISKKEKEN